jgi:hypothetical protein
MKEKTAKVIRIITIPPIEALIMLLILYGVSVQLNQPLSAQINQPI